ncbi:hypothetical protein OZL92_08670 [Bacillus sonorensis]|uniref:Flagellar operon protein YvyF n=2 Tax=Bacillus sonorensis TaxID=119858 RepID=M5P1P3_9BACI|nr:MULTISPECIES: TIGR03826 family flagellar region protein [Bacillus]TWK80534.1 hypothetical protein CHCC20335_0488 [Bacillus paralicheniformis]ASB87172.1 uncharacterized protein S101395_00617 [Bacillus sonorensis]EME73348.1 flagellar operon protein YvyF [Bacillus sonorensis L12]MBG9914335.1 membrane protein [Bacillus sonorensis]MCF7616420.1 hypothetical protein [Bacillus sonorensis]
MNQLANCPNCNALFLKNSFQTVCNSCLKEEERSFEKVYKFLKKQENRQSTMIHIVEKTGVEEELILKFIRQKRIQLSNFPNLGYPCERCGTTIREGRYCQSCDQDLASQISQLDQLEQLEKEKGNSSKGTYYTFQPKNN